MSPWKVILATMVIFGCGVITGGLLTKTVLPPAAAVAADQTPRPANATNQPPPFAQVSRLEFIRRATRQLDLSRTQRDDVARILKDSQERTRVVWEQIAPQMRDELKRVRKEIRDVLSPAQQRQLDDLLKTRPRPKMDGSTNRPARPLQESPATNTAPTNAL